MKVEIDGTGTIAIIDVPDGHIFFAHNNFYLRMKSDLHINKSEKEFTYAIEIGDHPRIIRFCPSASVNHIGEAKIRVVE